MRKILLFSLLAALTVQTGETKTYTNWFTGENTEVSGTNQVKLSPWEYKIFVSK